MNEMVNATTSLLPILAVNVQNTLYLNTSLIFFTSIATINHIFPENFEGVTHLVKLFVSNIIFSLIGLNPIFGFLISILDLSPLYFTNKRYVQIGELIVQIPRQIIDVYLIYILFVDKQMVMESIFILVSKLIYFLERQLRIKRGERSNFYLLHCFEHLGMYVLITSLTDQDIFRPYQFLILFVIFGFIWSALIFIYNLFIYMNLDKRTPDWIKKDPNLVSILKNKVEKNLFSAKYHNYICKPWTTHLKMEIITWGKLIKCCEVLNLKIIESNLKFDSVVGISTGGAFIGAYMAKLMNLPYNIIHSKLWSGTNFLENTTKIVKFFSGTDIKPDIQGLPSIAGHTILLCDDTTYTGVTMSKCKTYCLDVLKCKEVYTLNLWIHERFIPDFYIKPKRVPIFWEWGAEMD